MKLIRRVLGLIKRRLLFDPVRLNSLERKVDSLIELVKATTDIKSVPKVNGIRRLSQLANAVFLRKVVEVLDREGIRYWIVGGTLLGAFRHGGSVPWDDDVDIAVLRADHNRLVPILKKAFASMPNFIAVKSDTMRVMLTDSSCQVDIFAFDEYTVSPEAVRRLKDEYWEVHKKIKTDFSRLSARERTIVDFSDEEILAMQQNLAGRFSGARHVLMPGIEASTSRPLMWDWDWIFPLKKIQYEGMEFSCPNKVEYVLFDNYGDFMAFPRNMEAHSDIESRLTLDAYQKFEKILADNNVSVGGG